MPLTLRELEAHFLKCVVEKADRSHGRTMPDGSTQWGGFDVDYLHYVDTIAEADGISFICPKCVNDGGHSVLVFFAGRAAPERLGKNSSGATARWTASGTGLDDLVLTPSILLQGGGCGWHGFVGSSGIPPGHAG